MRVQVNLASRPFVELRPFFLRLRLIMGALALSALAVAIGGHLFSIKAEKQQLELDHLRNQTINVQQSKLHTEQRLRDPVNARVLDRAHFLNLLFLRKSFSWTAVMMDLENVLPNGVQVTSIEPQVSPDGNVGIRLRVAGERANAVQLVRNLERSRRFLQPRLAGEASQLKETNAANGGRPAAASMPGLPPTPAGVEFEVLAEYNPLPVGEAYIAGHGRNAATGTPSSRTRSAHTPGASSRSRSNGNPPYGLKLKPYNGPLPSNVPGVPQ